MKLDIIKLFNLKINSWDSLEDTAHSMYIKYVNNSNYFTIILRELSNYKKHFYYSDCEVLISIFLDCNRLEIMSYNTNTERIFKRVLEISKFENISEYYISDIYSMLFDENSGEFLKF